MSSLIPLDPWLHTLRDALPAAREAADPEAVHRMRTATRRLDVWLRLAGRARLRDDLRWLRRAAGPVRDLDALLGRDWPAREARRLRTLRTVARRALREALDDVRLQGLIVGLTVLPPLSAPDAADHLAPLARAARALPPAEDDLEALHAVRRAVRRLRFGLDWVGEPLDLAPVQDAFGELNDLTLAVRFLGPDAVSPELLAQRTRNALDVWRAARPLFVTWC